MTEPDKKAVADEKVPDWVNAQKRTCIGCAQTDNHPKIIMAAVGNIPSADVYWHHDCYVIAKAPGWEQILEAIQGAEGRTGHALRLHLMRTLEG